MRSKDQTAICDWTWEKSKAPWAAHRWIAQSQVYFCLCGKTSLVQNYWYENICHLYGHSHENEVIFMWNVLHKHSFCKRQLRRWSKACICAKGRLRPALISVSVAWSDWEYFYWMGCQSITGLPPNTKFAITYLYTWEDTEALWEQSVSPKDTIQCSQPGLEPRLLKIEKKYKNQITGCLHRLLTTFKMDNYWNWNIVKN